MRTDCGQDAADALRKCKGGDVAGHTVTLDFASEVAARDVVRTAAMYVSAAFVAVLGLPRVQVAVKTGDAGLTYQTVETLALERGVLMAERKSWFLAGEAVVTAGLCAAGFIAGGALGVLAIRVGSTLASDLAQGGRDTLKARWLAQDGALNHDIARALAEALKRARRQTAGDVRNTERYILLQRSDHAAAEALLENVEALGDRAQSLVENPAWCAGLMARPDLARLMATTQDHEWTALNAVLAQASAQLEDESAEFVQARLLRNWMAHFEEILKDPGELGSKAWRACQRLWQSSLSQVLAQVQADAAATRQTAEWLRAWAETLDRPPTQRDDTGLDALVQSMRSVLDLLDQIVVRLDEIAANARLIPDIHRAVTAGWVREADAATVAAAQELVAQLPLDELSPVGNLPAGSHVPLDPNPLFVGREQELVGLAQRLHAGKTAAVTGIGGVGKTQLAAEFVHRYGQYFAGGVFWLSMVSAEGVPTEVARRGERMAGLPAAYASLSLEDQVRLVEAAWQQPMPRLLVFDNCEDPALLKRWRPKSGGTRVLITSRRTDWPLALGVNTLPLHTLPRHRSVELLRKFRPDLGQDNPDLDAIAHELGDLPLALHLAGSYLAANRHAVTPRAYLERLAAAGVLGHPSLQAGDDSPTDHSLHVGRTFALSYDQFDTEVPTDALARRLIDLGLLDEASSGDVTLHRLVGLFVEAAGADDKPAAVEAVEGTLLRAAARINSSGDPRDLLPWQAHLRHVTDRAMPRTDRRAVALCGNLGYLLYAMGQLAEARPYLERALAIREEVLGPQHPDTANSLNNLGYLLDSMGQLVEARPYYERALAICEQILGSDHPNTQIVRKNLARLDEKLSQ